MCKNFNFWEMFCAVVDLPAATGPSIVITKFFSDIKHLNQPLIFYNPKVALEQREDLKTEFTVINYQKILPNQIKIVGQGPEIEYVIIDQNEQIWAKRHQQGLLHLTAEQWQRWQKFPHCRSQGT